MRRTLTIKLMVLVALLFSSCGTQGGGGNLTIVEAAGEPQKYEGQRVSWKGKPFIDIKAGETQPMIVIQPGYIAMPKTSKPIGPYSKDTTLLVEGVLEGVGGELGTFNPGGGQMGGAKLIMVKDATVSPAP